jgi:BirA family biotin operon repressor/biotin-[acetyl-CoA-carboxylase] ligase
MTGDRARSALAGTRFADVRWVQETGSTNTDLLDLARAGAAEGVVLVADHQSQGRGRLGRTWQAPPGSSLLVSILLRPPLAVDRAFAATMAVGLSAASACLASTGWMPSLKWPNDLVAIRDDGARRKLGGMLTETVVDGPRLDALVVGIGVNVNWPDDLPDELREIATAINHEVGREVDREDLLVALLRELDAHYAAFDDRAAHDALVDAYRRSSATLGHRVRAELADEHVEGTAVDLTPEGHLVLDLDDGTQREVVTADIVHLR